MRLTLPSALLRCATLAAAALFTLPLAPQAEAQTSSQASTAPLATPSVQVTTPVANDVLVTLKGNTHPMAQARYDQGAASASLATGRMSLLLKRSPAQSIALRQYMGQLQDPNSPNYHKWLTPASYGASFGISDGDLQTVEAWLQSEGFTVEPVPASRNLIRFSGTTGQVAQAFHTSIHTYLINGVTHYSNASDPQIPAALAPVIAGISPMNDFRAKAMHVLGKHNTATVENGHVQVTAQAENNSASKGLAPELTVSANNTDTLLLTPADAATIYNAPNVLNRNYSGTGGQNGSGVNIGVAEYSDLQQSDYNNYRSLFLPGISGPAPQLVVDGVDPGVLDQGDGDEALLDAEMVAALAPQAQLYFYSSSSDLLEDGLSDAIIRAIEDNKVSVLSVSYGNCEFDLGQSGNQFFSEVWQQAAAQGITPVIATGDSGSAACDNPNTEAVASGGLAVSGIASTPYDVAVGGSDFDVLATNFSQYVLASTAAENSFYGSALSYIPENPWNDSIEDPQGLFTSNVAENYPTGSGTSTTIISAGAGGASSAGLCTSTDQFGDCLAPGYPTPPFQSGVNVGTAAPAGVRYLPDVSLFAAPGNEHPAAWAFCSDNVLDGSTTAYTDCQADSTGNFSIEGIGGTSASTPAFAGILGMVIQSLGGNTRLGLANDVLYNLNAKGSNAFNDITVGNNSVPCAAGSPNCGTNGFLIGYNAGTGYDLASGLGSVNIANLITAWPTASFTPSSTAFQVNSSNAALTIVHGTAVTLAAQVTPNTATGTVSVTGAPGLGNESASEGILLTTIGAEAGTGSIQVSDLPGGTYNLQAYFPGDVKVAASTSNAISITVTPESSVPNLSLDIQDPSSGNQIQNPLTASYGQDGYAYVQPHNATGTTSHGTASGTATLQNNGAAISTQSLNSNGAAAFPLYNLSPGTYNFGAQYSGDSSYNTSSTTATLPLTISKSPTQVTIAAGNTQIPASASTTVTVTLATDSVSSTFPSGALTLTANGTNFPAASAAMEVVNGIDQLVATFNVSGASLASGTNTLTATYPGDVNYNNASATATLTVSGTSSTAPGFNLTGPSGGITVANPGTAQTGTVTISPTNGFTGTINLACTVQFSGTGNAPTCSVPATVSVTGTAPVNATVTINTTAQTALLAPETPFGGNAARRLLAAGSGLALCSILLWGVPARRRSWRAMLLVLFAFGTLGVLGCGSSNSSANGTPTGTYTATVTGTSGSVVVSAPVSINVE